MECRDVEREFDAWLDGELPPVEAEAMASHVEACPRCRVRLGPVTELLHAPAEVSVPAGLHGRIMAALEDGTGDRGVDEESAVRRSQSGDAEAPLPHGCGSEKRGAGERGLRRPVRWRLWATGVAACIGFFVMGWFASRLGTHPPVAQISPTVPAPVEKQEVVLSPWILSSWARAAAMPGPEGSILFLAQAAASERFSEAWAQESPVEGCRRIMPPLPSPTPLEDEVMPLILPLSTSSGV